jgi:hypothetical protein
LAPVPAVSGQSIATTEKAMAAPKQLPALAPAALDAVSLTAVNLRAQKIQREADKPVRRPGSRQVRMFAAPPPPPALAPETPPPDGAVTSAPPSVAMTVKSFNETAYRTPITHPNEPEPSVAVTKSGQVVLVTANTFAALSKDGGTSFTFINPAVLFPQDPHKPFFCDQTLVYDAAHDLMVWYMQHDYYAGASATDPDAGNLYRIAVAKGDDIGKNRWRYYDFTPQLIADWKTTELDFPDLTFSDNYLYVSTNVFDEGAGGAYRGAVTVRMPLDKLAAYEAFNFRVFTTVPKDDPNGFGPGSLRGARGAKTTMYLGTNTAAAGNNSLRVYAWKEDATSVTSTDVTINDWFGGGRGDCTAPGPDGRDWLGRIDGRMTAAWYNRTNDTFGFAWTSAQGTPAATFPFPHVRAAVFKAADPPTLDSQPILYSKTTAYAYPAVAADAQGQLGVSVAYGGGTANYPSHAVGFLTPPPGANGFWTWTLAAAHQGDTGPQFDAWGDYFWVCHDPGTAGQFLGVGAVPLKVTGTDAHRTEVQLARFRRTPFGGGPQALAPPVVPSPADMDRPATRREVEELRAEIAELRRRIEQLRQRHP